MPRVVPVVRVPSCARGPLFFVYCTCTIDLYRSTEEVQKKTTTVQPVAGDKKAGKRPTPSFLRKFLRFPRETPSVS